MIPDSVAVLFLLGLVAALVWGRHQQAMAALAYLEGFIDGRNVVYPTSNVKVVEEPYDWAKEGL